jgi:CDP-diacylglycerol--glycerol-3-phosphate 3-phosphatidyltransferase
VKFGAGNGGQAFYEAPAMKHLPNILTIGRLVLSLYMFGALVTVSWALRGGAVPSTIGVFLIWTAVGAFIVASVSDFFDGWLARRIGATSLAGAILDPIADKILVCGAIIGLMATGMPAIFAAFGGIILMREFAVSALREVLAPLKIKLPVTLLAKTKTTLQLVALGALMILSFWPVWGIPATLIFLRWAELGSVGLLAVATLVTLITGIQYASDAWIALKRR